MSEPIKAPPGCDYKRIEDIIEKDPALHRFLGQKTVQVERRNGTTTMHSPELIALVDAMMAAGVSPQASSKSQTLSFASRFLQQGKKVADGTPAPAPVAPPPAPAAKAPSPAPKKEEPPKRPPLKEEKAGFCAAIALANLTMSMLQLAEQYDTAPGADKRRDRLNSLASEYERVAKEHLEGCWDTARKSASNAKA